MDGLAVATPLGIIVVFLALLAMVFCFTCYNLLLYLL